MHVWVAYKGDGKHIHCKIFKNIFFFKQFPIPINTFSPATAVPFTSTGKQRRATQYPAGDRESRLTLPL